MAALRRLGIPIVYYVSPQLWAWRPGRMDTMKEYVDRVLVIFPFEEALYQRAGVSVQFVGHPLVDLIRPGQSRSAFLRDRGLNPDAPTVALLPGSRRNELERIVPVLTAALSLIRSRVPDVQFVVACAPNMPDALFAPLVNGQPDGRLVLVRDRTDDVLVASDVVITASGTATIQCALHEKPMVVVYRVSPLTYRLGKPFLQVDTFAMPNLVAGRRIVPELIQDDFTPERTAAEVLPLLTDPGKRAEMSAALFKVREQLGSPGATARAADTVLEVATSAMSS
jgi:lipid-A-disaccharide synthase